MNEQLGILLILIPSLPLAAAILTALLGPRILRSQSHLLVVVALAASFLCSLFVAFDVNHRHEAQVASVEQNTAEPEGQSAGYVYLVRLWTWSAVDEAYELADGVERSFRIDVTLRADALTAIMLSMVTFVSTLVAIYSAGYMHGERGYWRFYAYIGLFVFSMTMLVSVSNFILLFVFWEAVGVCSYLLIGFWYQKPEAAAAGKKAFLVNRVGDFAFTIAVFLIWTTFGTVNFHDSLKDGGTDPGSIAESIDNGGLESGEVISGALGQSRIAAEEFSIGEKGKWTITAICLLLMLGACGKSAQFPLHVWLPDAMEGPTPVSALIHAATMVTAGVYMVARCSPMFMAAPEAQLVVAVIGAFTALMAGIIALTQFDLKRVLAYSTVSQLGYMFLALGTGTFAGISSGMFHLFTHAFFKALLFLGAGSVMHAMGHIIDMRRFSGLRHRMPFTHWTFLFGCLALAGIVPFAGFWSKDAILLSVSEKSHHLQHELELRADPEHSQSTPGQFKFVSLENEKAHTAGHLLSTLSDGQLKSYSNIYRWLYYSAILSAFLTAFYTFRAFFMTFYGKEVIPHEAGDHAHESPAAMTGPLVILAVCALVVGVSFEYKHLFANFLEQTPSMAAGAVAQTTHLHADAAAHFQVQVISTVVAIAGILVAVYFYLGDRREVDWLKYLLDFQWLSKLNDVESVARLKQLPWVVSVNRVAQTVHLGWLAKIIGQLLLLVALVLSAPLLLGLYLTPYKLSANKFYMDEIYDVCIVRPLRFVAWIFYGFDRWIIDGFVNLCGKIPPFIGYIMRSLQTGMTPFYALGMIASVAVVVAVQENALPILLSIVVALVVAKVVRPEG